MREPWGAQFKAGCVAYAPTVRLAGRPVAGAPAGGGTLLHGRRRELQTLLLQQAPDMLEALVVGDRDRARVAEALHRARRVPHVRVHDALHLLREDGGEDRLLDEVR